MSERKYKEYKSLDLTKIQEDVLSFWESNSVFEKSKSDSSKNKTFTFYEGPPSANGMPGIHHILARTIKDLFCRYKTLKGFNVSRKAGWDTHGLPVELGVEKELGLTKEDIGTKISVEDYNSHCRKNVMRYQKEWERLTSKMGYWIDMENPYITYESKYIESVWWLLKELHKKELLYKGHTVQPYSPKAGTGLSTHELNQPGCYRDVKDTSVVAQFFIINDASSDFLFNDVHGDLCFLAWTTTPWTLPSNTALGVGKKISYCKVKTFNPYTFLPITVILAKDLIDKFFSNENTKKLSDYSDGDKVIPFEICEEIFSGEKLNGIRYNQLLSYAKPEDGDSFRVILGDFVTTDDGTGIVHLAPSFGADDNRVAKQNGIGSLTLVDGQGRFVDSVSDFAKEYVKEEYYSEEEKKDSLSVDVKIAIKLKQENKAFKVEKYEHSYPHCWRTDKPILYYPMDSWFVKTTKYKDRMIELNNTINWKPKSTGEGRFGNWLENLVDWNLSRSRFWGIPIPVWRTDCGSEEICIGSIEELKDEIEKSIKKGVMNKNPLSSFKVNDFSKENYEKIDLHKPYVDEIILVSKTGRPMKRESDLIDVWFDSGSMPYAQLHYPFENKDVFNKVFPADFIAEGVDQTRGWFFTLHAISVILFDSVAYKNVVSNGLVLDKNGNKMSKRLGNAVNPFEIMSDYGSDATRWYMVVNAQPWDNLKFDETIIKEIQRKFFGTIYNTYSFFALYANIDGFSYKEKEIAIEDRSELDRWILSELNTLVESVTKSYDNYDPTKAGREIQDFTINKLSNWYVRLSRRRFWKGKYELDKISAYQTLYSCLEKICKLSCPISPFFFDEIYQNLKNVGDQPFSKSIHLSSFPEKQANIIDLALEEKMRLAQKITSMALAIRKKERIRVRQPLSKILIPVLNKSTQQKIEQVQDIILAELNVKKIEFISDDSQMFTKKVKPNFKKLGPKFGKEMKQITSEINQISTSEIKSFESAGNHTLPSGITITIEDVEIVSNDIPGWSVSTSEDVTVALDVTVTQELKEEGLAREFVNRVQNLRKEKNYLVTDKIDLLILKNESIDSALKNNLTYICNETLTDKAFFTDKIQNEMNVIELTEGLSVNVLITKK